MMIGKNDKGEVQYIDFNDVKTYLEITSIELEPFVGGTQASPTNVPTQAPGEARKAQFGAGWYNFGSGPELLDPKYTWVGFWNGSTWLIRRMNELPDNSAKAKPWASGSYQANTIVTHNSKQWIALVDTVQEPSDTATEWKEFGGGTSSVQGEKLAVIIDTNNNEIASWDEKGAFRTNFADESIPRDAIVGLAERIKKIDELAIGEVNSDMLYAVVDPEDNILGYYDENGVYHNTKDVKKEEEVIQDNNEHNITKEKFVNIEGMDFFYVELIGVLPTDAGLDRTKVNMVCKIFDRNKNFLYAFNCKMNIQGQGSATYPKKGYAIDLFNLNWEKCNVKFGDWITADGFHMKAYHPDPTHARDMGLCLLWSDMTKNLDYPSNFVRQVTPTLSAKTAYSDKTFSTESANFITAGRPFSMMVNGAFEGLYSWRLKKSADNYAMNTANQNHVLTDSAQTNAHFGQRGYVDFNELQSFHEVKSPKSPDATTQANMMAFFNWWKDVYALSDTNSTAKLRAEYAEYIDLQSWIVFMILAELAWHWDSMGNNVVTVSFDRYKKVKRMFNDGDLSLGITVNNNEIITPPNTFVLNADIHPKFRLAFINEIKALYTNLRKIGVLSSKNYKRIFGGISENIPVSVYKADWEKWGTMVTNGIPDMDSIYRTIMARQDFLDSVWSNDLTIKK